MMSEPTTSPIIMALLFVLRCLIPLGVLFGISYMLRRLELVIEHSDEAQETQEDAPKPAPVAAAVKDAPPKKVKTVKKKTASGKKKKPAARKKKKEA